MSNDPEWQRIMRLGHEAKLASQAIAQIGFFFMVVVGVIAYVIVNVTPQDYRQIVTILAIVITLLIVVITLVGICVGMRVAFEERDEAMKAYFEKEKDSG